ncbi:PREDICTED: gamma-1-syntrophin-like [Tinamus guttatus]|uniref:gamma-1-syntrophin-like n=1 Tax=Tinamus guttatus TaxID=94827 RepID=UPI00052E978E|nr:PREDICTED: gamma-1-syntrophin-like [Tinamus guttatus]
MAMRNCTLLMERCALRALVVSDPLSRRVPVRVGGAGRSVTLSGRAVQSSSSALGKGRGPSWAAPVVRSCRRVLMMCLMFLHSTELSPGADDVFNVLTYCTLAACARIPRCVCRDSWGVSDLQQLPVPWALARFVRERRAQTQQRPRNGFHQDSDLLDRRKQCFGVQSETGEDLYFSVELESDLTLWEKAFQTATFLEVERIQCKTYACVLESHLMGLTIDFSMGFVCFDAATKAVLWRYKFSQLKGSSDDGKSKIKFLFQNLDTKQIEAKELEFSNLFAVLHCIHSFFAAKVACLDPLFVGSQATASAAPTTSGTGKLKHTT